VTGVQNQSALRRSTAPRWMRSRSFAMCLFGVTGLACSSNRDVLVGYNRASEGRGEAGMTSAAGASFGSTPVGSAGTAGTNPRVALGTCANGGPAIKLDTIGGCTTDLARRAFLFAICTCSDLVSTNRITTDSFDSRTTSTFDIGGSIGVNGSYQTEDIASQVGGSLWVMGDARFGNHDIAGDLKCAHSLAVTTNSRVHRNASVAGSVAAPTLAIDGSLTVQNGTTASVSAAQAGIEYVDSLVLDTPCNCQSPIDIAAITRDFRTANDNASQSLAASAFSATQGDVDRTLACGRYYFDSWGGTGKITLHLTGRTAIAIGSGISNSDGIVFDLGAGAELDLFVDGNLEMSGNVTMGDPNHPASTRVYVAGQAAFSANVALHANLYIPNYPMVMSAPSEVWGAIFAQSIRASGGLTVHYDQSILDLTSCTESGQSCKSCQDCANPSPACRNGTCAACETDSDCCPPLYCNQGLCQIKSVLL
jgi:hypothetical protein